MIDFHSHVLPGIDDGSKDIETSLKMLRTAKDGGVECMVATPHCHPMSQDNIDSFAENRAAAVELLKSAMSASDEEFPEIRIASEVRIYKGLSKYARLDALVVENTEYMLLEMPYEKWTDSVFEEIYQLTLLGFKPIMAHLDRFIDQGHLFGELYSLGALYQINTSAFLQKSMRRMMPSFFKEGAVHVIGSDTHNLKTRIPNLAAAYDVINKKFGTEYTDFLTSNSRRILENKAPLHTSLPKLSFFQKLFL